MKINESVTYLNILTCTNQSTQHHKINFMIFSRKATV